MFVLVPPERDPPKLPDPRDYLIDSFALERYRIAFETWKKETDMCGGVEPATAKTKVERLIEAVEALTLEVRAANMARRQKADHEALHEAINARAASILDNGCPFK